MMIYCLLGIALLPKYHVCYFMDFRAETFIPVTRTSILMERVSISDSTYLRITRIFLKYAKATSHKDFADNKRIRLCLPLANDQIYMDKEGMFDCNAYTGRLPKRVMKSLNSELLKSLPKSKRFLPESVGSKYDFDLGHR